MTVISAPGAVEALTDALREDNKDKHTDPTYSPSFMARAKRMSDRIRAAGFVLVRRDPSSVSEG